MKTKFLFLALFGALFCSASFAANNITVVPNASAGGRVVYVPTISSNGTPYIKPTWVTNGPSAGSVVLNDAFKVAGPAGKTFDLAAARALPWGTIARTAAKATGYAGLALATYEIYESLRVKPNASDTGWEFDRGQPEEIVDAFVCESNGVRGQGSSPYTACSDFIGKYDKQYTRYEESGNAVHGCTSTLRFSLGGAGARPNSFQLLQNKSVGYRGSAGPDWCGVSNSTRIADVEAVSTGVEMCPKRRDGTRGTPGYDGKCPTDNFEPISTEQAADLFEQNAPKGQARNIAEDLLKKDIEFKPAPDIKLDGAKKVESDPKVKTEVGPDGSTTTTTTKDIYNITYQGDSYTWNVTTTTEKSDGTKTEETKPDEEATPPTDPSMPERPKLYEQKYPDGLAGVWEKEMSGIKSTPIFAFLNSLNPNFGGSCPKWTFPSGRILTIDVGGDISVPCFVWSALRGIIVVSALLLARRLVFGG